MYKHSCLSKNLKLKNKEEKRVCFFLFSSVLSYVMLYAQSELNLHKYKVNSFFLNLINLKQINLYLIKK